MTEERAMTASDYSLGKVLSGLFSSISKEQQPKEEHNLLQALYCIYNINTCFGVTPSSIYKFMLDDDATSDAINHLKNKLQTLSPNDLTALNSPITYLLDELICNIQQHAQVDAGYAFVDYNPVSDSIEIVVADEGITIYGSYVVAQKHLELLGDSDAQALNLAQNGYSVKNLPETENRGYGISSNMRMVVEGLKGEFAVFSGNALLVQFAGKKEVLSLPKEIDFKGTMVIVRFPAHVPAGFDFYKYIS